jgi:hypothetical protein
MLHGHREGCRPLEGTDVAAAARPRRLAEIAEKTLLLQRKSVICGKCGLAEELKLQDFPHLGWRACLNGVQARHHRSCPR